MPKRCARADDDAVLEMLAMRRTMPTPLIAKRFKTTASAIRVATDRVMKADSATEGKDLRAVYDFLDAGAAIKAMHR